MNRCFRHSRRVPEEVWSILSKAKAPACRFATAFPSIRDFSRRVARRLFQKGNHPTPTKNPDELPPKGYSEKDGVSLLPACPSCARPARDCLEARRLNIPGHSFWPVTILRR